MKQLKYIYATIGILAALVTVAPAASAMMGGYYETQAAPTQAELQEELDMQNAGKAIYDKLQNNTTTCQNLTDDYEKLGEYFMGLSAGSTENHVNWDAQIQEMMGEEGDTNVHIVWGKRGSGCQTDASIPTNTPSFIGGMMGYQPSNITNGSTMMGSYGRVTYFPWSFVDTILATLLIAAITVAIVAWLSPRRPGMIKKKHDK